MSYLNHYVVGIDLGTTNACVGVIKDGKVCIVQTECGTRIIPSVISFTEHGILYGEAAINKQNKGDKNTVYEVKRIIGRNFDSPVVQEERKHWTFDVIDDSHNYPQIPITVGEIKKYYRPESISSKIIRYLVDQARRYTGSFINEIVLTCPAYFNDNQRRATREAGINAGYRVLEVLNEPTAAAIAYGYQSKIISQTIIVYDLGGGTFDVTILSIKNNINSIMATGGDTNCGGVDLNRIMMVIIRKRLTELGCTNDFSKPHDLMKLRQIAESTKIALSSVESYEISDDEFEGIPSFNITRIEFEIESRLFLSKTLTIVMKLMKSKGLCGKDIDEIVLIGGSSRVPLVKTLLAEVFGESKISKRINPDEAVAYGAVLRAYQLKTHPPLIREEEKFNFDGDDFEIGYLNGLHHIPITNTTVIPISYGLQVEKKKFSIVLKSNEPSSTVGFKYYTTRVDYQQSLTLKIFQGEGTHISSCVCIGEFTVNNLPCARKGEIRIKVEISVDEEQLLTIKASDSHGNMLACHRLDKDTTNRTSTEVEEMKKKEDKDGSFEIRSLRMRKNEEILRKMIASFRLCCQRNPIVLSEKAIEELSGFVDLVDGLELNMLIEDDIEQLLQQCESWNSFILNIAS